MSCPETLGYSKYHHRRCTVILGLTSDLSTSFEAEIFAKQTVLWSSVHKWAYIDIRIHDSKPSHQDLRELPARKGNKQQIREKAEQEMARKSQHISQRYRRHEMERNRRFLSQNMQGTKVIKPSPSLVKKEADMHT
ncbi:hypothetical protein PVK06_039802 [Gossypium arboreum]|uniref:Uncharacterized protein n=1 Tax=Gossypium arboreum TaxID=29729 RepID=A0ABR0N3T6_GOSAR|nr:hypothetical protein PVK06_039802 [Gossypium arboreum]